MFLIVIKIFLGIALVIIGILILRDVLRKNNNNLFSVKFGGFTSSIAAIVVGILIIIKYVRILM